MFGSYFDIREQGHGKCALCEEETELFKVYDQSGTAAHLAGWWMEAGVWGGGGASKCFHGNRKHSALAAYSLWNPAVFTVQPQLIFPIERADLWLCLFAHKKFADVSVERADEGQTETAKGQGDKE